MRARSDGGGGSTLLRALFALVTLLVVTSMGYATWIVVSYWGRVGV